MYSIPNKTIQIRTILAPMAIALMFMAFQQPRKYHIYTIGDSTMASKENPDRNPEFGWCQVFGEYFRDNVHIHNHAVNGRSSKSFISEGRWRKVLKALAPGDHVFIQFGHNDQKYKDSSRFTNPYTTYMDNLRRFVTEARGRGAVPVLFSSIVRRKFNEYGTLEDTHGNYPLAMRLLATELDVPFIDLQLLTEKAVASLGPEKSKELYLWLEAGENSYYPEGKSDDTHLNYKGARHVSKLAIEAMKSYDFPFLEFQK